MSVAPEGPDQLPILRSGIWTRVITFFGLSGIITIVALVIAAIALFLLWKSEDFRPYVSAFAGGLGVLLAAMIGLFEHERDKVAKWILAIAAGVFTILFAWYTTADLTDQLKAKNEMIESANERLQFLRGDTIEYVNSLGGMSGSHPTRRFTLAALNAGFAPDCSRWRDDDGATGFAVAPQNRPSPKEEVRT